MRSTDIRILPSGFGTTTMPAHQLVGVSTLEITPSFSIRSNSSLTFFIWGNATLIGVVSVNGVEPGFNLMLNSPFNSPRPLNNLGWFALTSVSITLLWSDWILSTLNYITWSTRSRALIAGHPNKGSFMFSTTNFLQWFFGISSLQNFHDDTFHRDFSLPRTK